MYSKLKASIKDAMLNKEESKKIFLKNFLNLINNEVKTTDDVEIDDKEKVDVIIFKIAKSQISKNIKLIKDYKKSLNGLTIESGIKKINDGIKKIERDNIKFKDFLPPAKTEEETNKLISDAFNSIDIQSGMHPKQIGGMVFKSLAPVKDDLDWDYVVSNVNDRTNGMAGVIV